MRKPNRNKKSVSDEESFINASEGLEEKSPWQKRLNRRYDKDSGKTINVRLPEYYSECLQWLAEHDNRSQHGELVYLLQDAIEQAIDNIKKVSK